MEWQIDDLDVDCCEVEVLSSTTDALCLWRPAKLEAEPREVAEGRWEALLVGVSRDCNTHIRVRGVDTHLNSEWLEEMIRPPAPAPAPRGFRVAWEHPDKRVIEWQVSDKDGGKIASCDLQVSTRWRWQSPKFDLDRLPERAGAEWWQACVLGYPPGQEIVFRVRGATEFGVGEWVEQKA